MKKILLIALSTLSLLILQVDPVYSQDIYTDIVGKKMSFFKKLEEKNNGKLYETDGDIIIPGGMAMPIMYRRVQKDKPDLIVNYVFTEKDSLIHTVEYEWDVTNYGDQKASVKPLVMQKAFIQKYNELLKLLTARYGASTSKGELADFLKGDGPEELSKSDSWVTKENTAIELYAFKSSEYKPVFKIKLYVSPKNS
ncbi:hypothetical protein SAMN04487898_103114 [Pedobacter sp. ok626]|uniref:hypothetical protein n=1 Tax=Pedobacter sp. ok626 TaxID=1761882 RepID=UPI00087F565B|nr:hypothetical protein [Pedobacter sp. ok626]SDJ50762.1 hypothetical protein SAMN04487898_103114 [Pedobacter sp. ok626]